MANNDLAISAECEWNTKNMWRKRIWQILTKVTWLEVITG